MKGKAGRGKGRREKRRRQLGRFASLALNRVGVPVGLPGPRPIYLLTIEVRTILICNLCRVTSCLVFTRLSLWLHGMSYIRIVNAAYAAIVCRI